MTYHIFIGYDEREDLPFQVTRHSILKHTTVPVKIHKLHHKQLRQAGLFTREWKINKDGTYECLVDGRPFSTQFSHSRFLVPELWRNINDPDKSPLVLFLDCDMVFVEDIAVLFKDLEEKRLRNHKSSPVYCVQHNYNPESKIKMDGCKQEAYNMKLWSSFMVFDMEHADNEHLLPETVNTEDGRWLHNFGWIRDKHKIGVIPESWNFIPNHSEKNTSKISNIHYTEGGAWFASYRNCRYASVWCDSLSDYYSSKIKNVSVDVESILHD